MASSIAWRTKPTNAVAKLESEVSARWATKVGKSVGSDSGITVRSAADLSATAKVSIKATPRSCFVARFDGRDVAAAPCGRKRPS